MPNTQFDKTLPDIIKDYLKDNLPKGYFKIIFYGDPLNIPSSLLPCIAIDKIRTSIAAGPTGMDKLMTTVLINLMYNKKEDFGKTTDELVGKRKLEEFAEAIDPATHTYSPTSIMGILRTYFTLSTSENGYTTLNQDVDIDYGIVKRPDQTVNAECQIKVTFMQLKKVLARQ